MRQAIYAQNQPATIAHNGAASKAGTFWPQCFLVGVVLLNSGFWTFAPHEDAETGSPFQQILFGVLYLAGFAGVISERKRAFPLLRRSLPIVLNITLVLLSTLWSTEPWITARRSFEVLGTCALATYFVCRLDLKKFIQALAIASTVAALLSFLLIFGVPEIGRMQEGYIGAWRGLYIQKNSLGQCMVLGLITVAAMIDQSKGLRRLYWSIIFALMGVLVLGSQSASACAVGLFLSFVCWLMLWCRRSGSTRPLLFMGAALFVLGIFAFMVGFGSDELLGLAGRDASLTGRTDLWEELFEAVKERPFTGYGYQAYFVNREVASWGPVHAHNGLLEAALDLGLLGALSFLQIYFIGIKRTWAIFWTSCGYASVWPILMVLLTLFANISENSFDTNSYVWLAFTAAYFFGAGATSMLSPSSKLQEATATLRIARMHRVDRV